MFLKGEGEVGKEEVGICWFCYLLTSNFLSPSFGKLRLSEPFLRRVGLIKKLKSLETFVTGHYLSPELAKGRSLSFLWVKGEPPLLSSSECAKLALVKIFADGFHWRGTSHSTGTISNPHPDASEQLPTAEISHARDIPLPPEPSCFALWLLEHNLAHFIGKLRFPWESIDA